MITKDLTPFFKGNQYLEVPTTNQQSANAVRFEEIASERGITIRYANE